MRWYDLGGYNDDNPAIARFKKRMNGLQIVFPGQFEALPSQNPSKIYVFVEKAFRFCLQSIDECDAVVGILDGADADSGTCVELGYAYARGKPIIGLRTDFRLSEDRGLNLIVANICNRLILKSSLSSNVGDTAREIVNNLLEIA